MDVSLFSNQYLVRKLRADDAAEVYTLCYKSSLYYQYCPPFVSEQSIKNDMNALPPNKEMCDKYYLGFYDGEKLIAVMDLIMAYPDESTAYIGFFMTDVSIQNTGTGSTIINNLCAYLARIGMANIRLCWVKGNPQAEHFWRKNGFEEMGVTCGLENYTVVVAQRGL